MNWTENHTAWNLKTGCYTKHMRYEDIKLVVSYHRIYEDMYTIDEICTEDGQNIIDIVRDRVIETFEKMIEKELK